MYLEDLKGSLGRDTDRARSLLAKLIGRVTLRRKGQRLVVELQGNLLGLLELDNQPLHKGGSGGAIQNEFDRPQLPNTAAPHLTGVDR
jgi:hypothetical protein